jgi:hypothetical protein
LLFSIVLNSCNSGNKNSIDRYALVTRHNITTSEINPLNSLTAGNGKFAFTLGITGLQSFPEFYENGIPLGTQSQWGWDFPLAAMYATLLNKPDLAVDFLMMKTQKNTYLLNGRNYQNKILTL